MRIESRTYCDLPDARGHDDAEPVVLPVHRGGSVPSDRDESGEHAVPQVELAVVGNEQHTVLDALVEVRQRHRNPALSEDPRADLHHDKVKVSVHVGGDRSSRCIEQVTGGIKKENLEDTRKIREDSTYTSCSLFTSISVSPAVSAKTLNSKIARNFIFSTFSSRPLSATLSQ